MIRALPSGQARWLYVLVGLEVATMLPFLNFSAVLSLVRRDWGLSAAEAGSILGSYQLGYVAAVFVLNSLTDVLGARRIYVISALWAGLANAGFALLAGGTESGIVWRFLTGVGLAGTYMPGMNLIAQRYERRERGWAVGWYVGGYMIGTSLSLYLTGTLAAWLGWRQAMLLTSAGPLLAGLVALAWLEDRRPPSRQAEAPSGPIWTRQVLLAAAFVTFLYSAHVWELFGFRNWLPSFLATSFQTKGSGLEAAAEGGSLWASLAVLLGAPAVMLSGRLSDRIGRRRFLTILMATGAVTVVLLGLSFPGPVWMVIGAALLAHLFSGADSSVISARLTEVIPVQAMGRVMGIYSTAGFVAGGISPFVVGYLLDRFGDTTAAGWAVAFGSLALPTGLAVLLMLLYDRPRR